LTTSANIQKGESVVVITDLQKMEIALPLAEMAKELGGDITIITLMMTESGSRSEPPEVVASALREADVILLPLTRAITHTKAIRNALHNRARAISLTGLTMHMLRGGAIEADFLGIEPQCEQIAERLTAAQQVKIRSPGGTDLEFDISGRKGNAMSGIAKKGKFRPFPNIEANIAPLEGTAKGIAVIDGSIPFIGIGIPKHPVILHIKDGYVVNIEGDNEASRFAEHLKEFNDPEVYNIAEFGIGLNPKAKLTGIVIEDEGVLGTAHIALGTSASLGGKVQAAIHYDLIMRNVSVELDGEIILDKGKLWCETDESQTQGQ